MVPFFIHIATYGIIVTFCVYKLSRNKNNNAQSW